MTSLAQFLADIVLDVARERLGAPDARSKEARLVFLGPPLEIMSEIFDLLVPADSAANPRAGLPVLLQVPKAELGGGSPPVGASGRCDHAHLLTVRDTASAPSFLALIPPDQHMDLSVATTVDIFGVGVRANAGMATFDEWWADAFVQRVVSEGIDQLDMETQRVQALRLVGDAARAADAASQERGSRQGAWRVLARLFACSTPWGTESASLRLSTACGAPPLENGGVDHEVQKKALACIATALEDGFRAGLDRAIQNAPTSDVGQAVEQFRAFIQSACDIPSVFERAPMAYYATSRGTSVEAAPGWWGVLTAEKWIELLEDSRPERADVTIEVMNPLSPVVVSGIVLVRDEVDLRITVHGDDTRLHETVLERRVGSGAKGLTTWPCTTGPDPLAITLPVPDHKSPVRFIALHDGKPASTVKVVSLATFEPGIHAQCRTALKLSPAKRLAKASAGKPTIECSLVLEGSGRHLIDLFMSPGAKVDDLATLHGQDDALGIPEETQCTVRSVDGQHFSVEVDASGDCDLDVSFVHGGSGRPAPELCRIHLTCAEVRVTGCSSEFDRLVRENRGVRRSSVQVDRVVRCSVLESWMLEESAVKRSWIPVVLGPDYSIAWSQPNWDGQHGPLMSGGAFISDPRPTADELTPPAKFIEARCEILRRIRGDDNSGLAAQAQLGLWCESDAGFRELVEAQLDAYMEWWQSDPSAACWSDVVAVASFEPGTETLCSRLDAILLSPLHPVRLAWHCGAQATLATAIERGAPCPAAALLDPDSVPDLLVLAVRGPDGLENQTFVSVECSSDYWSVLWNADALGQLNARGGLAPFGPDLGITVGGLARGFSPSQVGKALNDVADLLPAKPVLAVGLSASGVAADSCNDGIAEWSRRRFSEDGDGEDRPGLQIGPRLLEVHDGRPAVARPDEPTLSNLVEDTHGAVRWFHAGSRAVPVPVDLAIITNLDASQPALFPSQERSAISPGALLRHRVRRQLPYSGQAYLVESRQSVMPAASGVVLLDRLSQAVGSIENGTPERMCFRFAPDVRAIKQALDVEKADFVAVSSSAVDPGCFVGEWLKGAYLWDYSLPSYSQRAGDVCGSYLISRIKDVDREAIGGIVSQLPGGAKLDQFRVDALLHEVARRGIPTVRELSGDDSKAAGALGMFVAARILQDVFRGDGGPGGLLPVTRIIDGAPTVTILIPVDPFRPHIDELSRATKTAKDGSAKRPDLVLATFQLKSERVAVRLVPVEVKFRSGGTMSKEDSVAALSQARALSSILEALGLRAKDLMVWRLALNHLVLSMMSFGLRIYGQNKALVQEGREWSALHEALAAALLGGTADLEIDPHGRLIIIDASLGSGPVDCDDDDFNETMVVSLADAACVMSGNAEPLYAAMKAKLGDWGVLPSQRTTVRSGPTAERGAPSEGAPGGVPATKPRGDTPEPATAIQSASDAEPAAGAVLAGSQAAQQFALPSAEGLPPAEEANGVILELGRTVNRFQPSGLSLNLSDTKLNQLNIGVVGDLGTGKTQLLKSLIRQITQSQSANRGIKPRILIFDYKKDYSSVDFVEAVGAKVVKPYRMPLNLFDTTGMVDSMVPWLDRFKFFADVLDKIFSGIGPVQRDKLKQAVKRAYESADASGRMPSLYDVHAEYRSMLAGKADSPLAIIDDLVDSEVFTREPLSGASFATFFDGVVVVSLAAMGQDDRSKNMVVAIMLNMFYEHMLGIPKRPFLGSDPQLRAIDSYLLVDEADNIMQYEFDVLRKLLLQGREFGVGVVLASQYLRHFKVNATDYREPLLTWFIHKVPNVTPSELSGLGLTTDLGELAERVKTLPNHSLLFKSYGAHPEIIRGLPFFELMARDDTKD